MSEEQTLSMSDAFKARHSTRNFSTSPWSEEQQNIVVQAVAIANELPRPWNSQVELVLAPTGFGMLNFLEHENGWVLAKVPLNQNEDMTKRRTLDIGYLLQHVVMWLTQHKIATCWVAGTFKGKKAVQFCGGECEVPAVVAFGGEDQDRWLDKTVKWFGSWRGYNEFQDKFYDVKLGKPIPEAEAGDRMTICSALNTIPCAMKPHAHRVLFDEPNIHIFNTSSSMLLTMSYFDMGIVATNIKLYYESIGQKVSIIQIEEHPQCELGGEYLYTVVIEN